MDLTSSSSSSTPASPSVFTVYRFRRPPFRPSTVERFLRTLLLLVIDTTQRRKQTSSCCVLSANFPYRYGRYFESFLHKLAYSAKLQLFLDCEELEDFGGAIYHVKMSGVRHLSGNLPNNNNIALLKGYIDLVESRFAYQHIITLIHKRLHAYLSSFIHLYFFIVDTARPPQIVQVALTHAGSNYLQALCYQTPTVANSFEFDHFTPDDPYGELPGFHSLLTDYDEEAQTNPLVIRSFFCVP